MTVHLQEQLQQARIVEARLREALEAAWAAVHPHQDAGYAKRRVDDTVAGKFGTYVPLSDQITNAMAECWEDGKAGRRPIHRPSRRRK